MKIWSHTFDIKPTAVQSVRVGRDKAGKVICHQDPKKKAFKNTLALMAGFGKWHVKKHLIDYPIHAELYHFYEYPKALGKKARQTMEDKKVFIFPKTSRPDVTDNLNKGVFDSLKEILLDDSYVYKLDTQKFYAPRSEIRIAFFKPYVEDFLLSWCHGKNKIENNYYKAE